jgi:hypothetical protein
MLRRNRRERGDSGITNDVTAALQEEKDEEIRERLREAVTVDDIQFWVARALENNMEFEASLGQRKIQKLISKTFDDDGVTRPVNQSIQPIPTQDPGSPLLSGSVAD